VAALRDRGVTAFAMELLPRITRAQPMDVLSSQAAIGGQKAALMAACALGRLLPMFTSAVAPSAPPSRRPRCRSGRLQPSLRRTASAPS